MDAMTDFIPVQGGRGFSPQLLAGATKRGEHPSRTPGFNEGSRSKQEDLLTFAEVAACFGLAFGKSEMMNETEKVRT